MEIRMLIKIGNSLGITIPSKSLVKLGWREKDIIQIRITDSKHVILNKLELGQLDEKTLEEAMKDEQKN